MKTLTAHMRETSTKNGQLRRDGNVPCVLYGAGLEQSLSLWIDQATARLIRKEFREGSKLRLSVDNSSYSALIKEIDYDNLNDRMVHLSFMAMEADKKVNSVADIVLINRDKAQGILLQGRMQIPHAALPANLIDTVEIDLENIQIGTTLTIADIPEFQNEEIEILAAPEEVILRIKEKF